MQIRVIFALPSLVLPPWCSGQLPQSPTPRSTTRLRSCCVFPRVGQQESSVYFLSSAVVCAESRDRFVFLTGLSHRNSQFSKFSVCLSCIYTFLYSVLHVSLDDDDDDDDGIQVKCPPSHPRSSPHVKCRLRSNAPPPLPVVTDRGNSVLYCFVQ